MAASPDLLLLPKSLMRERCCHGWPRAVFTDTVWQHSTLSTVWLLSAWRRGSREVSQPLAPCSQTAIANAITPARPKRREIPRQTQLSLLPCLTSGQLLPLNKGRCSLGWAFPARCLCSLPSQLSTAGSPASPRDQAVPGEGSQMSCVVVVQGQGSQQLSVCGSGATEDEDDSSLVSGVHCTGAYPNIFPSSGVSGSPQ